MTVETLVKQRYSQGAERREEALCCPVDYDSRLLEILPEEIIERDYGCGDPSRYVKAGDTVLDLGSGGGKICYMAAQLVGAQGHVIGVDMTDEMLDLARRHQNTMAQKLDGNRVTFHKGYIQDLALDLQALEDYLAGRSVNTLEDWQKLQQWQQQQKSQQPLIADDSVDLVISNCVLNLVAKADRQQMISEIFRVLKPGGRVAIADIVSDEKVPESLQHDAELWSGCISGAFEENEFLEAFAKVGFIAVAYDKWDVNPWRVVEGIEFRSVTLTAVKPEICAAFDTGNAAIYLGPYAEVIDDAGRHFPRGERMAVSDRTFRQLQHPAYRNDFVVVAPAEACEPSSFCGKAGARRPSRLTKGGRQQSGTTPGGCC